VATRCRLRSFGWGTQRHCGARSRSLGGRSVGVVAASV